VLEGGMQGKVFWCGVWRIPRAPKVYETPISHRDLILPWKTPVGDFGRIMAWHNGFL